MKSEPEKLYEFQVIPGAVITTFVYGPSVLTGPHPPARPDITLEESRAELGYYDANTPPFTMVCYSDGTCRREV